jgi:hypothetical protein
VAADEEREEPEQVEEEGDHEPRLWPDGPGDQRLGWRTTFWRRTGVPSTEKNQSADMRRRRRIEPDHRRWNRGQGAKAGDYEVALVQRDRDGRVSGSAAIAVTIRK